MSKIYVPAYAKINLFLEITDKRDDGFHDIDSVMHTVSLCDDVTVEQNDSGLVTLDCPALDIPCEKNIAWKAAKLYLELAGINDGIHITIEKKIPWEAGLGGGSSDAGAVLRALNSIYGKFDTKELCEIGARIGSDIPFCVCCGSMRALGRGEILSPLPSLPDCYILLARGGAGVSTAEAYRTLDSQGFVPTENTLAEALNAHDIDAIAKCTFNRFEITAPYAVPIKKVMLDSGALAAMLSGSGSAVFGIFADIGKAKLAEQILIEQGYWSSLCTPIGQL